MREIVFGAIQAATQEQRRVCRDMSDARALLADIEAAGERLRVTKHGALQGNVSGDNARRLKELRGPVIALLYAQTYCGAP